MFTKCEAENHAAAMTALHNELWLVFRTPADAPCNQYPANLFNTGRYATCPAYDRKEYAAEGAIFAA